MPSGRRVRNTSKPFGRAARNKTTVAACLGLTFLLTDLEFDCCAEDFLTWRAGTMKHFEPGLEPKKRSRYSKKPFRSGPDAHR